jgi:hypothetical protein
MTVNQHGGSVLRLLQLISMLLRRGVTMKTSTMRARFMTVAGIFIVPFVALFVSDLILGLHNTMIFVYAGFALTVAIGFLLKDRATVTNTAFAAVASSVLFFLLTNFGVWMTSAIYAKSAEGLMQAYVAGIPFFQNSLLGNLIYTAVIFGGYVFLQKNITVLRKA